jgi:hypothetical protein
MKLFWQVLGCVLLAAVVVSPPLDSLKSRIAGAPLGLLMIFAVVINAVAFVICYKAARTLEGGVLLAVLASVMVLLTLGLVSPAETLSAVRASMATFSH